MKIETIISTTIAALFGACAVSLGEPVVAFAAKHVALTGVATSVMLLAGAAWIGAPRRMPPGAVPDFEAYSPPMSARSWLARNHVDARQESALVAKRVEIALEKQLEASSMQDLRVEALFLCLLKVASKPPGSLELLDELSRAVGGSDPTAEVSRFIDRHGLQSDPDVVSRRRVMTGDHGTPATMVLGALERVRIQTRCPSSAMTWLKQVDRSLWYAVSNLGRSAYHVEGIAAIAHYHVEIAEGCRSAKPRVEAAMQSLIAILSDPKDGRAEPVPEAAA